jgi:hypothetical protein
MTKGVEGGDTVITLEPKQRVWIFANEVAQCDVSFPSDGNWDIAYWVRAVEEGETGTVYTRVGYADSTGKTVRILHRTAGISHPTEIEEIVENGVAIFTVPEGGRLAIANMQVKQPLHLQTPATRFPNSALSSYSPPA